MVTLSEEGTRNVIEDKISPGLKTDLRKKY